MGTALLLYNDEYSKYAYYDSSRDRDGVCDHCSPVAYIYSAQLHQRKFSPPTGKVISQLINICAVNGNFCL